MKKQLKNRGTDSSNEIDKRLQRAFAEIKTYSKYDYVIINYVLEDAVKEFMAIIISHKVRTEKINPLWIEERFFKQEEK